MAPNIDEATLKNMDAMTEKDNEVMSIYKMDESTVDYDQDIKWFNVVGLFIIHVIGVISVFSLFWLKLSTFLFVVVYGTFTVMGITAAVHRLWSHRSYKAKLPLRIILMLCYAMTGQNKLAAWVRDHRVHHKFSETPADPHNAKRGLFFSHWGWLLKKKHPICLQQGNKIDMSDIKNDMVVQFHDNNFVVMKTLFCFVLPTVLMKYYFDETWTLAFLGNFARFIVTLNGTFTINSLAHTYGHHPYDKNIGPTENTFASMLAFGEGWHNYHHTFPWDYRTSEFGVHTFNVPTMFIDFFAWVGWAYDRKTTSRDMILRQAKKKGDGTRFIDGVPFDEVKAH